MPRKVEDEEEDDEEEDDEEEDDEEEEDDVVTLQDVKDVADTVKSIAEAGVAFKKLTETSTPRPSYSPPSPNLPLGGELDKMIREAKEKAVSRAFLRGSAKKASPPSTKRSEKKEGKFRRWVKGFGKWIITLVVGSVIVFFFWFYFKPFFPT